MNKKKIKKTKKHLSQLEIIEGWCKVINDDLDKGDSQNE